MAQQAWYKRYEEYRDEALRYMTALSKIKQNSPQALEILSFERFSDIKLIFESNTIEKAGTKTEGETREIIDKYFPHISGKDAMIIDDVIETAAQKIIDTIGFIPSEKLINKVVTPSITFDNTSRGALEVLQHRQVLLHLGIIPYRFYLTKKSLHNKDLLQRMNAIEEVKKYETLIDQMKSDGRYREKLYTEDDILMFHKTLANDLLPKDADVEAGNYRIHDIEIVGADIKFPAPELVPPAMTKFIEDSNSRVEQVLPGKLDEFIMVTAEVSYKFVRIHPFPDFNGRMSRLLLAMTLRAFGLPFNLALRGSVAKYRNRYFYALKRANHGDLKPYATLIAMRLVESFQEIDDNLRLAGQKTLLELNNETP